MPYTAALCCLNAKYIHSSLAPWCLAAGVSRFAPEISAHVIEGTINEPPQAVLARILALAPDVAAFTCYLWNIHATLALAANIKAAAPHTFIVLGGPEVSYNAAEVLAQNSAVDCILSGEGETSLPALLRALAAGDNLETAGIAGYCSRSQTSAPCVLGAEVPSPYTDSFFAQLGGRIAYLETSRGCPYSCAFCLSGRCGAPRYFALEHVQQNILALANSGTQTVKFIDRTFNANPQRAAQIVRFILEAAANAAIPQGVCFHFEIAGDILTEELFSLFAAAPNGLFQLEIGMQSFCEQTLAAVRRKTNTAVLRANICRLVAMGNMHIHIDLIAGLPHETLALFARSFDIGYSLGAQMLQLGFLKLLHGSAMRDEPQEFPCEFSKESPYEVISTPWLAPQDFAVLRDVENALERTYNTGRFLLTAQYVLAATGLSPFAFYAQLGKNLPSHHVPLDAFTAHIYHFCTQLAGVDAQALRDAMVCDRLATNATGRLPACLQVADERLKQAVKTLAQVHPPKVGVRRGVALLYGKREAVFVDYDKKHPVTQRYVLHLCRVDNVFC